MVAGLAGVAGNNVTLRVESVSPDDPENVMIHPQCMEAGNVMALDLITDLV